jgi:hypothetical protein
MTNILPLQQNFPITDVQTGFFTPYFKRYMDSLLARLGGITGGTYTALANNAGTVIWDLNSAPDAALTLVNGTNTISSPLNLVAGLKYYITVIQPASGAAGTISYPGNFKFPGGSAPTLSTANSAVDMFMYRCDGTNLYLMISAINEH